MNVNPAAASVAGTARAAARGGEADSQANAATSKQATADQPAGKSSEAAVDANDQTEDRYGDGRQVLDVFEHAEENDAENEQDSDQNEHQPARPTQDGAGDHIDLEA